MANPYIKDGKPQLLSSYCVYMDMLGLKEKTVEAFQSGKEQELFKKLHLAMSQGSDLLGDKITKELFKNEPFLWEHKIFTDNVVLGCPISKISDGEGEFGILICQLGLYQMSMALEGLFVRGSFTIGKLYVGEEMAYGMALIEAALIEKEISDNPRIVISEEVMKIVRKHLEYYGNPKDAPQNIHIITDADTYHFVNYLATTIEGDYVMWSELDKHRQNIEKCLVEFQSKPRIWSKYLWLANYHNWFCQSLKNNFGYKTEYLVDSKLVKQAPRRLLE